MNPLMLRLGILVVIAIGTMLLVRGGQAFVERQRQQALQGSPTRPDTLVATQVRLLVFSSADCRPCHTLQAPAVQQVRAARGTAIVIEEIDAPSNLDLSERYHILTVPSTVVLDVQGQAVAVNYGFAPAKQLLAQIDAVIPADIAISP